MDRPEPPSRKSPRQRADRSKSVLPLPPSGTLINYPRTSGHPGRSAAAESSKQQTAEEALRRSEERWQLVLQGNHQGIWDWDIVNNQSFYSTRWKEMLGYAESEISNTQEEWHSRIHPDDYETVFATVLTYLDRKIPTYQVEFRMRCKNGSYKWIQARGQAVWDETGRPIRMVGSHTDITAQKRREESLRLIVEGTATKTGDEFFKACVRCLAEALQVRYALITEVTDQSRTKVRTLAYWTGNGWADSVEYDLKSTPCEIVIGGHQFFYPNLIQERFPEDRELVEMGVVSYLGIPLADASGTVLGHLAVLDVKPMESDVERELILKIFAARTKAELERRATESALRNREAQYRDLVQTANCIILRWTTTGQITFMNQFGLDFFGYSQEQLLGQSIIGTIVPETDLSGFNLRDLMLGICAQPEQHLLNENENLRRDGTRVWIAWSNKPLLDTNGLVSEILSIGTDITERKRAEQVMEQAKQAAEAASRVKTEFLANMSHELRTPLNVILGFAQLLARHPNFDETQKDYLQIINNSGEHLLSLINDVLDMAKIEAGQVQLHETEANLLELLITLESMFHLKAEAKGLEFISDRSADLPQVIHVDLGKLRQVLINLLSNAVKFTEQGRVILRVRMNERTKDTTKKQGEPDKKVSGKPEATHPRQPITLIFEVEDTGPGIQPDDLDRIFAAFVQTETGRHLQGGTGLGLSISRRFAQLMQGDITVSSVPGQGTCFRLAVPIVVAQTTSQPLPLSTKRVLKVAPDQPTYRILVVEDRWESRHLLVNLLRLIGFEVQEASNGREAIDVWERWHPHLVWMDMQMPVMDGYEATRYIKGHLQGQATVVIALTASALEEERVVVLSAGCDDFVRKPFQENTIFQKMADYLGIRYLYEESDLSITGDNTQLTASVNLSQDRSDSHLDWTTCLETMPLSWITQLHDAAIMADNDLIYALLEDVPDSHSPLIEALVNLLDQFRYDTLMLVTERVLKNWQI